MGDNNRTCGGEDSEHYREAARRMGGAERGRSVRLSVDGTWIDAPAGASVAAAVLSAGQRVLRYTARRRRPRGVFCGMGVCCECAMTIDGRRNTLACRTPVTDGMCVESQHVVKGVDSTS